jgi:uncharacterized protein (DUF305 family)
MTTEWEKTPSAKKSDPEALAEQIIDAKKPEIKRINAYLVLKKANLEGFDEERF